VSNAATVLVVLAIVAVSSAVPLHRSSHVADPVGMHGVDVSVAQTVDVFKCFRDPTFKGKSRTVPLQSARNDGPSYTVAKQKEIAARAFTQVVIRTPLLSGQSVVQTVKNAVAAGYTQNDIGVYFINFKANKAKATPTADMDKVAASIAPVKDSIGTLWLDVEGSKGGSMWHANSKNNCNYFTAVVNYIQANAAKFPPKIGVYTGMWTWPAIMGTCDFTPFKNLPLWYAAYDSSFDTFNSFKPMKNAWPRASVHQWHGTTRFCGTVVDFNVYK